jgi:FtsH-binding integral membrane protein
MILIIKAADKSYFLKIMVIFILTGIEEIAVNKTMKLLTAQRFVRLFSITLLLLLGISALGISHGGIRYFFNEK